MIGEGYMFYYCWSCEIVEVIDLIVGVGGFFWVLVVNLELMVCDVVNEVLVVFRSVS